MCGGGGVEDNSAEVARIQAQENRRADQRERKQNRQDKLTFNKKLNSAYQNAINTATDFFTEQGLDPAMYRDEIVKAARSAKQGVPSLDGNPNTYFDELGSDVYNRLTESMRGKNTRVLDTFARNGFENEKIADTSDDAIIDALFNEQKSTATEQLDRLRARGTLTDSGYAAALDEIGRQGFGVKADLDTLGKSLLEKGRGGLREIVNTGKTNIGNLKLGENFDPYSYDTKLSDNLSSFFSGLNDSFRGSLDEDLFDTSKAFSKGGVRQGAQNTRYDPNASAGIFNNLFGEDDEEDDDEDALAMQFDF